MNILLVDDHSIVRAGLCQIIKEKYHDVFIEEAGTQEELLKKINQRQWTLLILDISLGLNNSLDLVPNLLNSHKELKIIILSMYNEHQFAMKALHYGVLGYVTKDRAPEELLMAMNDVLQGKRYVCAPIAMQIVEYASLSQGQEEDLHKMLSSREYEVFLLLANAKSVSEISQDLDLSVKTISTYRSRILEKLNLTSNAQIMKYAIEKQLLKSTL